jgi:hypothetical protein
MNIRKLFRFQYWYSSSCNIFEDAFLCIHVQALHVFLADLFDPIKGEVAYAAYEEDLRKEDRYMEENSICTSGKTSEEEILVCILHVYIYIYAYIYTYIYVCIDINMCIHTCKSILIFLSTKVNTYKSFTLKKP